MGGTFITRSRIRNAFRILVGKLNGEIHLEDQDVDGMITILREYVEIMSFGKNCLIPVFQGEGLW
jgi:hypothetical protein